MAHHKQGGLMADILSFEDFKKSKKHQKKLTEIEGVLTTLSLCQKSVSKHKDYLLIQQLMNDIHICMEKFLKIKELEELHYEYQNNKENKPNDNETLHSD